MNENFVILLTIQHLCIFFHDLFGQRIMYTAIIRNDQISVLDCGLLTIFFVASEILVFKQKKITVLQFSLFELVPAQNEMANFQLFGLCTKYRFSDQIIYSKSGLLSCIDWLKFYVKPIDQTITHHVRNFWLTNSSNLLIKIGVNTASIVVKDLKNNYMQAFILQT